MKVKCNSLFDVKFLGDVQINSSVIKKKTITANGTYNASDDGADGYNPITVNVPNVIPDGYIKPEGAGTITENGTYDVTEYKTVQVNVDTGEDTEMVYTFKDELAFPLGQITQDINFTSNGTAFVKMIAEPYYIEYVKADGTTMLVYSEHDISTPEYGHWEHGDWKTVNLGTGNQTMSAEFYDWFIANVTEGGGTTEDVTTETEAYTAKVASLKSAVSALETELAGKASGGNGSSSGGVMPTCKVRFSYSVISNFSEGELYMTSGAEIVNTMISDELHYADMTGKFTSISIYDSSSGTFRCEPISSLTSDQDYEVLLGTIIDKGCYGNCKVSGGTVTEVHYDTRQTGGSYLYIIEPVASNIGATIVFEYNW